MARVTGIGGVFFKSKGDPTALATWYQKHLGLTLEAFGGAVLKWPDDRAEDKGMTVWHVAAADSQWFAPSGSAFVIILYAFKSDTSSHVWKLWVIRVASLSRCFVGRSVRHPSMAS